MAGVEFHRSPWTLVGAVDEVVGEGFEGSGGFAEGREGGEGVGDEGGGVALGLLEAVDGGPGGFVGGGVFACGFAELGGVLGHVEDVVYDLEGEAGLLAEGAEAGDGVYLCGGASCRSLRSACAPVEMTDLGAALCRSQCTEAEEAAGRRR